MTELHRFCPSCGAEAKAETTNCEKCWRPLPMELRLYNRMFRLLCPTESVVTKLMRRPWSRLRLHTRTGLATRLNLRHRPDPGAGSKRRKWLLVIPALALLLIVGGIVAKATTTSPSVTQTLSYKDGFAFGDDEGTSRPTSLRYRRTPANRRVRHRLRARLLFGSPTEITKDSGYKGVIREYSSTSTLGPVTRHRATQVIPVTRALETPATHSSDVQRPTRRRE